MSKNVSNNFKNVIKSGGPFYSYASVTLKDGTELTYTSENDFTVSGTEYSEGVDSGFPLGEAVSKMITLNLDNTDAQNDYDYYYARITLYTEADMPDGTVERVQEGVFTVIDSVTPGETLEITAYDDMYKGDVAFTSTLSYPVSAQQLLIEVCSKCDIALGSAEFANNDFQIQAPPEGLTGRQVIGYIAQIAGGNAVIDRTGHLTIKTYDLSGFDTQETVTPGEIETASGIHIISEFTQDPEIGTDDVTITGVTVTIESDDYDAEDEVYTSGTDEYAIKIDNPLISGQEKDAVDLIADIVVGITARPFSGTFMPDPTIEFMDLAYVVDRKDNVYKSFVTSHDFAYLSNSTIFCGVESPERHGASYYSTASEVYQKAKEGLKENKTQWEQAIEQLSQQVANASGLYTTEEEQPDGSTIFYMHNKPTLEESDIVWQMTAETLTVSTDGGKTWNAGITVNGEVIAKIMSTIGINFDWGVGGTLIIQDAEGNQTAYIDAETGAVRLSVQSLTITGKTVQEIASEQSDSAINDFVDAVYNPGIANLQAQIDGQIETYYYDYEPTLSNEPASEWTTEEERQRHEGDLFYWKSKGYAYRFFKDGSTWKWQMVQDTDITSALEQAAQAQDTADQKRRVFVATPTPPYDVGDLWTQGTAGDIMRCRTARQSGSYNANDWVKASKYTDDSALEEFISGDFRDSIDDLKAQADQKAETWYQSTDPSTAWTTTTAKNEHIGDIWYNTSSSVQKSYRWNGTAWQEMKSTPPDAVFDEIDGKAQIFISTPTVPYYQGDLWFNSTSSDIMTCIRDRTSGSYTASDWQKRNKYTDDSFAEQVQENLDNLEIGGTNLQQNSDFSDGVNHWSRGSYWTVNTSTKLDGLNTMRYSRSGLTADSVAHLYSGSSAIPARAGEEFVASAYFYTTNESAIDGQVRLSLWFYNSSGTTVESYQGYVTVEFTNNSWVRYVAKATAPANTAYVAIVISPYRNGTFFVGKPKLERGNRATDWSIAPEDTATYADNLAADLQDQIDGKVETYSQTSDPSSSWTTTDLKTQHTGDLWYNPSTKLTRRWSGTAWVTLQSAEAEEASELAQSKAQIFISTPTVPYYAGDLWFNSTTSDIMTCIRDRTSGSYTSSDWQKRNKYTDDSAVDNLDNSLDQDGVFNRLTNNGATKGIYMSGNQLYVNASYIKSGTLVLGGTNNGNGTLSLRNASNVEIGRFSNNGIEIKNGGYVRAGYTSTSGSSIAELYGGGIRIYKNSNVGVGLSITPVSTGDQAAIFEFRNGIVDYLDFTDFDSSGKGTTKVRYQDGKIRMWANIEFLGDVLRQAQCSVFYNSSNYTIAPSSGTKRTTYWASTIENALGLTYATQSGFRGFTVKKSGWYFINVVIHFTDAGFPQNTALYCYLDRNNVNQSSQIFEANNFKTANYTFLNYADAGDFFSVALLQNSGSNVTVNGTLSRFNIIYVGS